MFLKVNRKTGKFVAVARMRFRSRHDVAVLRGEACLRCGVAPTYAKAIPLPRRPGDEDPAWGLAETPVCLSPWCGTAR